LIREAAGQGRHDPAKCGRAINLGTDGAINSIAPQAMTPSGDNDTSVRERPAGRRDTVGTGWKFMSAPPYMILVAVKKVTA